MSSSPADPTRFAGLSGGGDMGARIRAFDWSRTPVGPIDTWPASLRTTVNLLLNSKYPMFLWWGPEKINFYNDGYIPVLGKRHPDALGRPAAAIWSDIWNVVGPLAEVVIRESVPTWNEQLLLVMERYGFTEETYFTFSYSPAFNDEGQVGGVFCACTEDTRQVIGQRRLKTLGELAARAVNANSAEQACASAIAALAGNAHDVPFAALYLLDEAGTQATLAGATGVAAGSLAAPAAIDISQHDDGPWPLGAVAAAAEPRLVEDLASRIGPLPAGPWPEAVTRAIVLPIQQPAQEVPAGLLVLGLSPRLAFDDEYQGFCSLIAGQVAAAIGDARAQEADRRRAAALAELDRAKTAFFSNVSHELRTPLTLMLGPVDELLAHGGEAFSAGARQQLETVRRNARRLLKLVNMLLDFARVEAGRMQATYEPVALGAFTSELASVFRSAMQSAGLEFAVRVEPLPADVHVDRQMWEKIVMNLLSNALKYTLEGRVEVRVAARGAAAELTISDTGTGVPADELPRLFERFHRVHGARARTYEGTGIGLSLVQELVRMHGGSIAVSSEQGAGTTFTVSIPFGTAHLPPDRIAERPESRDGHSTETTAPYLEEAYGWLRDSERPLPSVPESTPVLSPASRRLSLGYLIVADDNRDMRNYVCRLLESRWSVLGVSDGHEALAAARRRRPDAIVTDIMMPGLDGLGLLRELRHDEALRSVPVILLSARAAEESRLEGLAAGADDYLVKPFSARELIARVETQIMRSWLRTMEAAHNQKLVDTFRDAPVAVAILEGPTHVYTFANDPYLELVGGREVLGKPVREALPELADQGVFELLDAVYHTGRTYRNDSIRAVINRGPGGEPEEGFFKLTYQPMFDAERRVEGLIVVAVEVTELAHAQRAAEAANRAKDEFLAMLGHELRNPLAPIFTALELMRLRGDGGDRERGVIHRQVRHLTGLVDDLLDVSRITRGKITLHRRPIAIAEVVGRAVEMASPLLEQQQHELSVDVPRTGCEVEGDHDRLAQVVANLLTNAAKYTPTGGRISIAARTEDGEVVLRVRDNGVGITADMLPHVFDLFAQERQDSARAGGGLGLGLAIVRNLVQLHGGSVSAHSEGRDRGSEFVIRLPRLDVEAAPAPAAPVPEPAQAVGDHSRRVLVVDDNRDAAAMLGEALRLYGHDVRIAADGVTALRVAEEFRPDVALLDLGLPVMDGYELARRIRAQPDLAQTRLVALTGYGQEGDRRRTRESGFAAHLVKPVDLEELKDVVSEQAARDPAVE
jgi:signal transduction histidine kinase/DNA-binding response OmpR family regulator